jgi:hypothetical protein
MMKHILTLLIILSNFTLLAQNNSYSLKLNVGAGYQGEVFPMKYNTPIEYEGFTRDGLKDIYTMGAYIDIGATLEKSRHDIGIAIRFSQSHLWNTEELRSDFIVDFLPRAWYSYYFGKQDNRGFRVDLSLMLDWEEMGVIYDPVNPSDIPNNPLYVCFGPQVGTRIIRKGAFANTYLTGGPVFAPPVKFDSYIVEDPSWNIRWMIGLSKSLSFKKSSK